MDAASTAPTQEANPQAVDSPAPGDICRAGRPNRRRARIDHVRRQLDARSVKGGWSDSLLGGVIAGGVCALLGVAVSCLLGDVEPIILVIGTLSSAVGGLVGGAIGELIAK